MPKEANSLPFLLLTRWMDGAMVLGALALWCKVALVICNTGNPLAPTTCIVSQPAHLHISGGPIKLLQHCARSSYSISGSPTNTSWSELWEASKATIQASMGGGALVLWWISVVVYWWIGLVVYRCIGFRCGVLGRNVRCHLGPLLLCSARAPSR